MAIESDTLRSCLPAEVFALGTPEQIHHVSPPVIWACWFVALACFPPAVMALYFLSNPLETNAVPQEAMLIAAIAFGTGSLVAIDVALSLRALAYLVFPGALVEVLGGRCTIFRWEQIEEVLEQRMGAYSRYRILLSDGQVLRIAPIVTNYVALSDTIVARVNERVTPQTRQFLGRVKEVKWSL
jgi:hypothetical protein